MFLKLVVKNIVHNPLRSLLCWVLVTISVGAISLLLIVKHRFEQQFEKNLEGVDMVLGAKGSPLQLVLSAVYHIDAPTGNINVSEVEKWMKHPYVATAIPLAYGDSYNGYRIVGTTPAFLDKYSAVIQKGTTFQKNFEVVAGSTVAAKLNLQPGSRFYSTHGNDEHGEAHTEKQFTVTGVLKPTGTVIDNLLTGTVESVWEIHHHDADSANAGKHDNHEHEAGHKHDEHDAGHKHDEHKAEENEEEEEQEYTAVLLKFRNPMGSVQLPRVINEKTNMMAALPAIEINRLFSLFGSGAALLKNVGWGIMLLSGLSIFVALLNSLKERKYELALIRILGAGPNRLLLLVLLEGLLLSLAGVIAGLLLSRLSLSIFAGRLEKEYHLGLQQWNNILPNEWYLAAITLFTGFIAAVAPALKARFINISKTLSHE